MRFMYTLSIMVAALLVAGCHAGGSVDTPTPKTPGTIAHAPMLVYYYVTYNSNGATGGLAPLDLQSYTPGATVTLASNPGNLSRTNYVFTGWNTAPDGSGEAYIGSHLFIMPSAHTTFYAQWSSTRTVTYNANGGLGFIASQILNIGGAIKLKLNTFTRWSYTFAGWARSPTGPVVCLDGQPFQIGSSNVTLYAVWVPSNSLLVNYNFDAQAATDTSGRGNHGSATNILYYDDGADGYSARFDGYSSLISLPNSIVKNTSSFTLLMRFKAVPTQYGVLFGYQDTAGGVSTSQFVPMLAIRSDGKLRGELWAGTQLEMLSAGAVNDCQWHTVYISAGPGSIKMYLDGFLVGSSTDTLSHQSMNYNQLGVGQVSGRPHMPEVDGLLNDVFYFNGLIDDLYLYNTAI